MIIEYIFSFACDLIYQLFSGFEVITLPTQLIGTLTTFLEFGVWIVGTDILSMFVASVVLWWGVHLSIGLAVWLWKLLPLT